MPKYPSEINPTNPGQAAREKAEADKWRGVVNIRTTDAGPHTRALLDVLQHFTGGRYEREIWDIHHRCAAMDERDTAAAEKAATAEGLTPIEYVARETLAEIRRHCGASGIAMPRGKAPKGRRNQKPPPDHYREIYQASVAFGDKTTTEIAELVSRELKKTISQQTVSAAIKRVVEWNRAAGIDTPDPRRKAKRARVAVVDPGALNMGPRTDSRKNRRRNVAE